MNIPKHFYELSELPEYVAFLQNEAETSCDHEYSLRIAGQCDALEKLHLISMDRAGYIRSLAGVRK